MVILLIDRLNMHYGVGITDSREDNLIRSISLCFFQACQGASAGTIEPYIRRHIHILMFMLWLVSSVLDRCLLHSTTSTRRSFGSMFNNFGANIVATGFMSKISDEIAWHEPVDVPTLLSTSQSIIRRSFIVISFIFFWGLLHV